MTSQQKEAADQLARLQQMKINTRLTALQSALEVMKAPNYSVFVHAPDHPPEIKGGSTDHLTLLAMAKDIEEYILGNIEKETNEFLNKPKPTIVPAKEMPSSNLRP